MEMKPKAIATGNDYVKYEYGRRTWWRAILDIFGGSMRVSRKTFNRAGQASDYKGQVLGRINRMRGEP